MGEQAVADLRADRIVGVPVIGLSAELKRQVAEEAAARELSLNDFCVGVIAEHLGFDREDAGGPVRPVSDSPVLGLRMPATLRKRLNLEAADREISYSALVRAWLAEEVGMVETAAA